MTTTTERAPLSVLGRIARAFACLGLAYWGLYALVTPVTNADSQIYNLARVVLAGRGGLFSNPYWTSPLQIMFPWTYDALHWPLFQLGFGYALPSYFCFFGTCLIVFKMTRNRAGPEAAWVAIVGLLALPCLVYQATSTKNDIPLVFCCAVWLYARWRWLRDSKTSHLLWMALAIGFMAGTKTTGIVYGGILSVWMLFELRRNRSLQMAAVGSITAALLLFGSIETYIESARLFGHPLGPPQIVQDNRNCDGLRGGAANLSRYIIGNLYFGQSDWRPSSRAIIELAAAERILLAHAGLTDAGTNVYGRDKQLFFYQTGFEELSGFGPLGSVGIGLMFAACFYWRPRETWWQLTMIAVFGLALISITIAYMQWNSRFLIGHFALTTIACTCLLWQADSQWRRVLRWGFVALAVTSATAAPLVSFNRGPACLVAAIRNRQQLETCMVPVIGKVLTRLHQLRATAPQGRIIVAAYHNSAILPYLTDPELAIDIASIKQCNWLLNNDILADGDILILDSECTHPRMARIDTITAPNPVNRQPAACYIYQIKHEGT
jgi:4-amino-4-deoxy-L-arabinose transferase-like glycosyltransferase